MKNTHEVSQRESIVSHHALDLVEFSQVSGIQSLIPEHPVNGEILHRGELLLAKEGIV